MVDGVNGRRLEGNYFKPLQPGVKKSDLQDEIQKALLEKFDENKDGTLQANEAEKHNKSVELTGEDFDNFVNEMGFSPEDIPDTVILLGEDKSKAIVTYKDSEGNVQVDTYDMETKRRTETKLIQDGVERTIKYNEDGTSTEIRGAVTTVYDSQGRVIKKTTDRGSGGKEVVEYTYEGDSTTPSETKTTFNPGGLSTNPTETAEVAEQGTEPVTHQEEEANDAEFEPQRNAQGQMISYAKNGESFRATARRLGFEPGTPEYDAFVKANSNAAKKG